MTFKVDRSSDVQSQIQSTSKSSPSGKFDQVLNQKSTQQAQVVSKAESSQHKSSIDQFKELFHKGASPQELVRVATQNNPLFKSAPHFKSHVQASIANHLGSDPLFTKMRG